MVGIGLSKYLIYKFYKEIYEILAAKLFYLMLNNNFKQISNMKISLFSIFSNFMKEIKSEII